MTNPADNPDLVHFVVGQRGDMTKHKARQAAKEFARVRKAAPDAYVMMSTAAGYDDDPRPLGQFPEVCRYMRQFAREAGLEGATCLHMEGPDEGVLDQGQGQVFWLRLRDGSTLQLDSGGIGLLTTCAGLKIEGLNITPPPDVVPH
jgi:hypothetical protein